jgi:hypothetical protein
MANIWLPDFLNAQPLGSTALWSCLAERLPWGTGLFSAHFPEEEKNL